MSRAEKPAVTVHCHETAPTKIISLSSPLLFPFIIPQHSRITGTLPPTLHVQLNDGVLLSLTDLRGCTYIHTVQYLPCADDALSTHVPSIYRISLFISLYCMNHRIELEFWEIGVYAQRSGGEKSHLALFPGEN